jgi:hypothetical protein
MTAFVRNGAKEAHQAHSMTENELKQHILAMAKAKGWIVYHVPQSTMKNGGGKGYPDLTLARDGEVQWMELKAEHGKLTGEQAWWQLALPRMEVIRPSDLARGRVDELLA